MYYTNAHLQPCKELQLSGCHRLMQFFLPAPQLTTSRDLHKGRSTIPQRNTVCPGICVSLVCGFDHGYWGKATPRLTSEQAIAVDSHIWGGLGWTGTDPPWTKRAGCILNGCSCVSHRLWRPLPASFRSSLLPPLRQRIPDHYGPVPPNSPPDGHLPRRHRLLQPPRPTFREGDAEGPERGLQVARRPPAGLHSGGPLQPWAERAAPVCVPQPGPQREDLGLPLTKGIRRRRDCH